MGHADLRQPLASIARFAISCPNAFCFLHGAIIAGSQSKLLGLRVCLQRGLRALVGRCVASIISHAHSIGTSALSSAHLWVSISFPWTDEVSRLKMRVLDIYVFSDIPGLPCGSSCPMTLPRHSLRASQEFPEQLRKFEFQHSIHLLSSTKRVY